MNPNKKTKTNKKRKQNSSINDLGDLQHEELSGAEDKSPSTATSSTDEDEDEGLGDGNIGRSKNNILGK